MIALITVAVFLLGFALLALSRRAGGVTGPPSRLRGVNSGTTNNTDVTTTAAVWTAGAAVEDRGDGSGQHEGGLIGTISDDVSAAHDSGGSSDGGGSSDSGGSSCGGGGCGGGGGD